MGIPQNALPVPCTSPMVITCVIYSKRPMLSECRAAVCTQTKRSRRSQKPCSACPQTPLPAVPVLPMLHSPAPTIHGTSYLAERVDAERRRLHQLVRRHPLGLAPLKEVLAFGDQDGPFGERPAGILARSGRHARGLERAVVPGVLGRTGLQGKLSGKRQFGRIEPSVSTGETGDVLIYPFE